MIFKILSTVVNSIQESAAEIVDCVKEEAASMKEEKAALAYTGYGHPVKGYKTLEEARCHRMKLYVGTQLCFPNGSTTIVEIGAKETCIDNWYYAWIGINKPESAFDI